MVTPTSYAARTFRRRGEIEVPHPGARSSVRGMSSRLVAVTYDAQDPAGLAEFWGKLLGRAAVPEGDGALLQVNIRDANGALVRRMTLPTTSGLQEFSWDGIADNGTRAAAGEYTFEALASVAGRSGSLEMLMAGRVNSVTIDAATGLTLNTSNLGSRALGDVRRVM